MELKELSRRISRYWANVENLQLEKNRLLNEIHKCRDYALVIFLALQKQIYAGLVNGSVKE